MRTIFTSISLFIFSILLVIGCELINKSIQEDSSQDTEMKTLRSSSEPDFRKEHSTVRLGINDNEKDEIEYPAPLCCMKR